MRNKNEEDLNISSGEQKGKNWRRRRGEGKEERKSNIAPMISSTALGAATERNFKQYIQPRTNNWSIPDSFRIHSGSGGYESSSDQKEQKRRREQARKCYAHNNVTSNGLRCKRQFNSGWIPEYFHSVLTLKQHQRLQRPTFGINQWLFSRLNSIWLKHIQPGHAHPLASACIRYFLFFWVSGTLSRSSICFIFFGNEPESNLLSRKCENVPPCWTYRLVRWIWLAATIHSTLN